MIVSYKITRLKKLIVIFVVSIFVLFNLVSSEKSYAMFNNMEKINYADYIHMIQFSHLDDDLFKTPKNFDERMAKLSFKITSPATQDILNKNLQLELFDKRNQTIQHTTFYINVLKNDRVLFQDLFHAHAGLFTIIFSPNNSTKNWEVTANREGLWFRSENDKFNLKTPILEEGQYDVHIAVIGVDDDKTMFPSNSEPKFDISFTVNEKRVILDNAFVLEQKNKLGMSPLKQFKSGTPIDKIRCNNGLLLVLKSSNENPACVKPETKEKLIERGWAKPI